MTDSKPFSQESAKKYWDLLKNFHVSLGITTYGICGKNWGICIFYAIIWSDRDGLIS